MYFSKMLSTITNWEKISTRAPERKNNNQSSPTCSTYDILCYPFCIIFVPKNCNHVIHRIFILAPDQRFKKNQFWDISLFIHYGSVYTAPGHSDYLPPSVLGEGYQAAVVFLNWGGAPHPSNTFWLPANTHRTVIKLSLSLIIFITTNVSISIH